MEKIKTIALVIVSVLLIATTLRADLKVLGSVTNDGVYTNKTLTASNASTTAVVVIRGGSGVFGSMIISSSTGQAISVYDGTATTTGTLIATFPASATVGTYTFDVSVRSGIVIEGKAGFNGSYVITHR